MFCKHCKNINKSSNLNKKRKIVLIILLIMTFIFIFIHAASFIKNHNMINQITISLNDGTKYLKYDDFESAKKSFENAINASPNLETTYIIIKDYFIDYGRYDDAFYFIKLATKNGVNNKNLNLSYTSLRNSFEPITLSYSSPSYNTFVPPNTINIKINDSEIIPDKVIWEEKYFTNNEIGEFIFKGSTIEYERSIILKLVISP